AAEVPVGWVGEPRLLRGTGSDLVELAGHLSVHGPLPELSRDGLLAVLDAAALAGRGGAGFPLATKLRSLGRGRPVVVVNGAEGEPVSAKDHALLSRTPHLVLDGAATVAGAIGARRVLVAVTDPALTAPLQRALASRPDRGLFELHQVPDRFIAGEARALLSALQGGTGLPPGRRVLPTERGLDGQPTLLSNAETFAQLAVLARLGAHRFREIGTAAEPGSTLLTVSGAVRNPGVIEVPLGTPLATVAGAVGALPSQAVVVGGYHGSWLPAATDQPSALPLALPLSRAGLAAAGGSLGAGVLIFLGEDSCGLAELARVAGWLAAESAKQCGPCAFGLPALAADVQALVAGRPAGSSAARHAGLLVGRGACAHPDGAVRFISSGLAALAADVHTHRVYGGCRRADRRQLATVRPASLGGSR
ncbi:MAG: NADH-ubiquinone oxidoreductase-F iron-sulfur binding region domain-containing protein, partial [Jatrophihabitantaceae bacterium]